MLKKLLSLMDIETIRRLRLNPINQVAELKLKEAAQPAFPCLLPVFQLMNWGLANGVRPTHNRTASELLRLQSLPDQGVAFAYLVSKVAGGLPALQKKLLRQSPRSAAEELLEVLDMRLKSDPENPYPAD